MANHANLTTPPTVPSRDSLPSDGSIIPVNKPPLRPAKSWLTSESKLQPISGRQSNDVSTGMPLRSHDSQATKRQPINSYHSRLRITRQQQSLTSRHTFSIHNQSRMHMSHMTTEHPYTSRIQSRNYRRRNDNK